MIEWLLKNSLTTLDVLIYIYIHTHTFTSLFCSFSYCVRRSPVFFSCSFSFFLSLSLLLSVSLDRVPHVYLNRQIASQKSMIVRIRALTRLFSAKKDAKSPCILPIPCCYASDINNDLYSANKKEDEGWMLDDEREREGGRESDQFPFPSFSLHQKKRRSMLSTDTHTGEWMDALCLSRTLNRLKKTQ